MLYKVVLTIESVDEILKCGISRNTVYTEQFFPVVLFVFLMLHRKWFQDFFLVLSHKFCEFKK